MKLCLTLLIDLNFTEFTFLYFALKLLIMTDEIQICTNM